MIYIDLKKALKPLVEATEGIKTFDWYNQQYENTDKEQPELYPAVYFEILEPIQWREAGNKMQTAKLGFRLHLVVNNLLDNPEEVFLQAEKLMKSVNHKALLKQVLNNLDEVIEEIHLTTELVRSGTSYVKRFKMLKVMFIDFMTEVCDRDLMDPLVETDGPVTFNITLAD